MEDFHVQTDEKGEAKMSKIEIHGNRKVLIIGTGMLGLALMDEFKKDKMWSA